MKLKKEKILQIRMDAKLYAQLKKYADRNDESIASVSARRAIRQFLKEEEVQNYETINLSNNQK